MLSGGKALFLNVLDCRLAKKRLFYWLCLINQHNRDAVPDFVQQLAAVANQTIFCIIQMNIALAFGACQDIQ